MRRHPWSLLVLVWVVSIVPSAPLRAQGWTRQTLGSVPGLYDLCFSDVNHGTAVGINGTILRTTDGGGNWRRDSSGTSRTLYGVFFLNADTGYVTGSSGLIMRTTNGGALWEVQYDGPSIAYFGVSFVDASHGTVVGDNGTILQTSDGGMSWVQRASGTTLTLKDVSFPDPSTGIIVGSGVIVRTTNGGASWSSKPSSSLFSVSFADARNGMAVGSLGKIYTTSDAGQSWSQQTFLDGVNFTAISRPSPAVAVAVGYESPGGVYTTVVVRTLDGGKSWYEEELTFNAVLFGVSFPDADHGWIVGSGGAMFRTNDGGGYFKVPLLSPVDEYTAQLPQMPLRWHAVPGALSYRVQVSTDPSFLLDYLILNQSVVDTLVFVPGMSLGMTYYWGTQINTAGSEGPWSRTWSFTADDYAEHTVKEVQFVPQDSLVLADSVQSQGSLRWTLQASSFLPAPVKTRAVCVVPPRVLVDRETGEPVMLACDVAADSSPWHGIVVRPASSIQGEFFKIQRGNQIICAGGPDEAPPGAMNSMTYYRLQDFLLEDSLEATPRPAVREVGDFHRGGYTNVLSQFTTGEPYEGSIVEFHDLWVSSAVNASAGTVNLSDRQGNTIPTSDMSIWFTLRSHRHPASSFTIPPLGALIDTIRGVIVTEIGYQGRTYRIAPVFPGDIVYGAARHGLLRGRVVDDFNRDSTLLSVEPGVANWPVLISGKVQATLSTDPNGEFSLGGLDSGTYIVTQGSRANWSPTYPQQGSYLVTLGLSDSSASMVFGNYFPWNTIGGSVFHDLNENGRQESVEPGLSRWLVHLNGNTSDSAWTDSVGLYDFKRVDAGMTMVSVVARSGWEQILPQFGASYAFDIQSYGNAFPGLHFSLHPVPERVKIALTVHDSTTFAHRDVWWGTRPGATFGIWGIDSLASNIDYSEAEFEIPPETDGLFDARFVDPHLSLERFGYGSWVDMREYRGATQTDTFQLTFRPGYLFGGDYPMTVSWSKSLIGAAFSGPVMITDGAGFNADMKTTDSVVITDPAIISLTIVATGPLLQTPTDLPPPPRLLPATVSLEQNFPNPFNPVTTIAFSLPETRQVRLTIVDLLGREVATLLNGELRAGAHAVLWDGSSCASGVYFCRLSAGDAVRIRKLLLVR